MVCLAHSLSTLSPLQFLTLPLSHSLILILAHILTRVLSLTLFLTLTLSASLSLSLSQVLSRVAVRFGTRDLQRALTQYALAHNPQYHPKSRNLQ